MPRLHRLAATAAATTAIALLGSACTGGTTGGATDDVTQETTITFWHGWSAESEVTAIKDNVAAFEAKNPKIKIKIVGRP